MQHNNFPSDWERQSDGSYIDSQGDRFDANGKHVPFTKAGVEHPGSRKSGETKGKYRERVDQAKAKGFHLGDLSWSQWHDYCDGYGE